MKKIILVVCVAFISSFLSAQTCEHTLPSSVLAKKSDGTHIGTGDGLWLCEDLIYDVQGNSNTVYIEKGCDILISGDQNTVYMKAPGDIQIDGNDGVFEIDSAVGVTDNGTNNNIKYCNSTTANQFMIFRYDNISGVIDCIDTGSVGIHKNVIQTAVNIYPNPAHDVINVVLKNQSGQSQYKIFSMSGQVVLKGVLVSSTNQIDLSELDQGLYFIEIQNNSGKISKRLSIE